MKFVEKAIIAAIALLVTALLIYSCGFIFEGVPCYAQSKKMGYEYSWGAFTGCMIQVKGQWVPIENYKVVE